MAKRTEQITVTIEAPCGINSQTGKSEEIAILAAITDRVRGTQTYLDSLFTDGLLDWFTGKVRDDFAPDMFMEYMAELETSQTIRVELQKARSEVDGLKRDKESMEWGRKCDIDKRDKMIGQKEDYILKLGKSLGEVRRDYATMKTERDTLSDTVIKLKVQLFDLMNEKAA